MRMHWAERLLAGAIVVYSLFVLLHDHDTARATYWLWLAAMVEATDLFSGGKEA